MNLIKKGIYVDLDALLDTRLATIVRLKGVDFATDLLLNSNYLERETDTFKDVDPGQYKELYAARDKITLRHARVTLIKNVISSSLAEIYKRQGVLRPEIFVYCIKVNIHPYVLDPKEIEILAAAISGCFADQIDVELINVAPDKLTPAFWGDQFAFAYMYDWDIRLGGANDKLYENCKPIGLDLVIPKIWHNGTPTEDLGDQPFEMVKAGLTSTFVRATPLDSVAFSVALGEF